MRLKTWKNMWLILVVLNNSEKSTKNPEFNTLSIEQEEKYEDNNAFIQEREIRAASKQFLSDLIMYNR